MHFPATESSSGEGPMLANPEQENLIQKVLDMTVIPGVGQSAAKSQGVQICITITLLGGREFHSIGSQ